MSLPSQGEPKPLSTHVHSLALAHCLLCLHPVRFHFCLWGRRLTEASSPSWGGTSIVGSTACPGATGLCELCENINSNHVISSLLTQLSHIKGPLRRIHTLCGEHVVIWKVKLCGTHQLHIDVSMPFRDSWIYLPSIDKWAESWSPNSEVYLPHPVVLAKQGPSLVLLTTLFSMNKVMSCFLT